MSLLDVVQNAATAIGALSTVGGASYFLFWRPRAKKLQAAEDARFDRELETVRERAERAEAIIAARNLKATNDATPTRIP